MAVDPQVQPAALKPLCIRTRELAHEVLLLVAVPPCAAGIAQQQHDCDPPSKRDPNRRLSPAATMRGKKIPATASHHQRHRRNHHLRLAPWVVTSQTRSIMLV